MIEESLRRDLGLDDLAEIWARVTPATEDERAQGAAAYTWTFRAATPNLRRTPPHIRRADPMTIA